MRVAVVNGKKVVPLEDAEKLEKELNSYKIAYRNIRTMYELLLASKGNEGASDDSTDTV